MNHATRLQRVRTSFVAGPGAFVVVVVLGTLLRIPQINDSLAELHAFRQTQTAMTAREFFRNGIDLFSSPLTVFGSHGNAPLEFPLFQALSSVLMHTGLDASAASRLMGLISFQFTAVMLYLLVSRLHGRAVALVASVLLQFLPFGFHWGSASLIEFLAVGFALGMLVGLQRWLARGSLPGLVLGSLSAVLAFLVKSTTAPGWVILGLAMCWVLIAGTAERRTAIKRAVIGLAAGPVLGLIVGVAWTAYADAVKTRELLPAFLTSSALRGWNFGTLRQRFDPSVYEVVATRMAETIAGPALLFLGIGLVAIAARGRFRTRIEWAWIAVALAPLAVFTNLYFQHDYYLSGIYPALVVILAIGIVALARLLTARRLAQAATAAMLTLFLGLTTWTSTMGVDYSTATARAVTPPESVLIDEHTQPEDHIVMAGCTWDPAILYFADRTGLSIEGPPRLEIWDIENPADYSYLLICSPDHEASEYLPTGYEAQLLDDRLYRIVKTDR
jgi:4-amino-4-deoxy-L-arabinose transferase-like glycosyltransferase